MTAPAITFLSGWSPEAFLISRGWAPSGRVTTRHSINGNERITWWWRGDYEYPEFFALDLERLGWVKILEVS